MILFYHILKTGANRQNTPEDSLAQRMAHLPENIRTIAGTQSLSEFIRVISKDTRSQSIDTRGQSWDILDQAGGAGGQCWDILDRSGGAGDQSGGNKEQAFSSRGQCSDAVGLVFDARFWYGPECWQHWMDALDADGLQDMPNIPVGNQEPDFRRNVSLSVYVTLRGLENAAQTIQADRWKIAAATRPECFSVVVVPCKYLGDMPRNILLQELPIIWAQQHLQVRLFGGGWLHSFTALGDAGCRHDLLDMVDWHGYVLELGCDRGLMARTCKESGSQVTWIGLDRNLCALETASRHVDLAVLADADAPLPFSHTLRFDRVVCGDFLEHLAYPWQFLERLRHKMAPGGFLVASFPNVGHWSVIEDLLAGRWDETPSGIMCVTHLRFGTRVSWQRWLDHAGWQVVRWEAEKLALPPGWQNALSPTGVAMDLHSLETLRYRLVAGVKDTT